VRFWFTRQTSRTILAAMAAWALAPLALLVWLAPIWSLADIFRQVWPLWMLMATIVLAALILSRQPVRSLAIFFTALIAAPMGGEIWRARTVDSTNAATEHQSVIFATHNIWGRNRTPQQAADYLIDLNADVLALQETGVRTRAIHEPVQAHYAYSAICHRAPIGLFSNLPIIESGCMRDILDTHRSAGDALWRWDFPASSWARIELPDGETFVAISVHFTWPNPLSSQDQERINFAEIIQVFDRENLVILGDFNAAAPSAALERFDRDIDPVRRTHGVATWPSEGRFADENGGTLSVPTMIAGIDHIYAGRRWATMDIHRGPNTGSDHRPVIATLALNPAATD
jgi:endonuclease/exonuclease/phosphatase (EEP) superfamily protein YafD